MQLLSHFNLDQSKIDGENAMVTNVVDMDVLEAPNNKRAIKC